ncbi:MAG: hypothetical protein WC073_10970 [Sterolibacterium sp.]
MKHQPTPTLDKLKPFVAALHEPFTLKDIMIASGMEENPARSALMSMKNREWVINTGKRIGNHGGQALWTRTRMFGVSSVAYREHEQRSALALLGQCLSGWRRANHV